MIRLLFALLLAASAAAQAALAEAQALVNEAAAHFRAKEYAEALAALQKAEPIAREANDPALASIRFNIARCFEELERWQEARGAYEAYLELPDDSHRKARAWDAVKALEARVLGAAEIACRPAGAQALVKEHPGAGRICPVRLGKLEPGTLHVTVQLDGYLSEEHTIEVRAGRTAALDVTLKRDPAAAPAAPPPAAVVAAAPEPSTELTGSPWPWATAGVGVALLAGGGVLTVLASSDRDDASKLPPTAARDDLVESFEVKRDLSYAAYGVGAAAVVGGVLWMLLDAPPEAGAGAVAFRF